MAAAATAAGVGSVKGKALETPPRGVVLILLPGEWAVRRAEVGLGDIAMATFEGLLLLPTPLPSETSVVDPPLVTLTLHGDLIPTIRIGLIKDGDFGDTKGVPFGDLMAGLRRDRLAKERPPRGVMKPAD